MKTISFYLKGTIKSVVVAHIRHYTYIKEEQRLIVYDGSTIEVESFTEEMYWSFHEVVSGGEGARYNVAAGW